MPPSPSDTKPSETGPSYEGRQARPDDRNAYPAEKARQGTIILRHWWSRAIFITALAAGAIFAVLWSVAY